MNPYAVASCAAKSMSQFRACLTVLSLLGAVQGRVWTLSLTHALNSVLFMTPLILTPVLALLGSDTYAAFGAWRSSFGMRRVDAWWQFLRVFVRRTVGSACIFLLMSYHLSGDASGTFLRSVYGSRIFGDNLAPTVGLYWYFFVEMFSHFFDFFLMVVQIYMWMFMVPVTLKYRSDLIFAATVLLGIVSIFQAYACLGDTAVFLAVWSLSYGRLADYLRYPMVSFMLFAYSTLFFPAFYYLWTYTGSANANFYYAINLVHALGIASVVLDGAWAWGRERWEYTRRSEVPSSSTSDSTSKHAHEQQLHGSTTQRLVLLR